MISLSEKYEHLLKQNEVYNDRLQKQLRSSNIAAIVQGTGTGKTYQILQIIHDMCIEKWCGSNHINVLIIVPTTLLVNSWNSALRKTGSTDPKGMGDFERDLALADENEEKKFATNEARVTANYDFKGTKISYTYEIITYDGLRSYCGLSKEDSPENFNLLNPQVKGSLDSLVSDVNLIVFDEAHHLGATTTAPIAAYIISKANSHRYVVGMTATDVKVNGKSLKSFFSKGVVNGFTREEGQDGSYEAYTDASRSEITTNNERVLPKINWIRSIVYDPKLSTSRSIFTYFVRWIKSDPDRKRRDQNLEKLWSIFNNLSVEAYSKYAKQLLLKGVDYQKLVCFYQEGENVSAVRSFVKKAFGISNIVDVHSDNSSSDNDDAFDSFKNSKEDIVILAVNKISEGVHVGDVTGIIMIRSTLSPIIFNQQVGRAMSFKARDKVIPIFDIIGNSIKHQQTSDKEMELFLKSMEEQMDDTRELQVAVKELTKFTEYLRSLPELKEGAVGSESDLKNALWTICFRVSDSEFEDMTDYSIQGLRQICDPKIEELSEKDKYFPYDPLLFQDKHYRQVLMMDGTNALGKRDLPLFYYIAKGYVKKFSKFRDRLDLATWLHDRFGLNVKDVLQATSKLTPAKKIRPNWNFYKSLVDVYEELDKTGLYLEGLTLKEILEIV